jgi:sporulation protein YlmC with PRC-barrel domain
MKLTENKLIGKTVMSKKGLSIGIIKECLINEKNVESESILVSPSEEIQLFDYKINSQGDIIIPMNDIIQIKDVVILEEQPV